MAIESIVGAALLALIFVVIVIYDGKHRRNKHNKPRDPHQH